MKPYPFKTILIIGVVFFYARWYKPSCIEALSSLAVIYISSIAVTYFTKNKAKLYFQDTPRNKTIIEACPSIKAQKYQPPFIFQSSFLQLLGFQIFMGLKKTLKFRKEKVIDPANKIVGLSLSWTEDLAKRKLKREDVLVFVLPGLTGGETDSYIHQLVDHIYDIGYKSVVYNYRLLSDELSFKNNKNFIDLMVDLRLTIQFIKDTYPEFKHIVAIGHSYGANQIVNYLGRYNTNPIIKAAVSIANPFCMNVSSKLLRGTIYDWLIARILGEKLKTVQDSFADAPQEWGINMEKAVNAKTVYEFDSNITIKFYGFPTVDTYYRKMGSINEILNVSVPLFCLSANDDDIANEKALPRDESNINPNIILMETDRGSHVVWLEGNNPFSMKCWFPKPACEFLDFVIKELD